MVFIETPIFTKALLQLLSDDEYRSLQTLLADHPESGDLIRDTGGLRKIRVQAKGHGKRGGARAIYYHFVSKDQIAFLFIYPKNERDDLTADERAKLRGIVETWR